MTNEEAISVLNMIETHGSLPTKAKEMSIKALEFQASVKECKPPTDNWEQYADKLYELAYKHGYDDAMKQVAEVIDSPHDLVNGKYIDISSIVRRWKDGTKVQVNNADELCRLMCDNDISVDKEEQDDNEERND